MRWRTLFRGTAVVAGVGGVSSLLAQVNIENPEILPKPVRAYALGTEAVGRFAVTSYYIVPVLWKWLLIEKWHAKRLSDVETNKLRDKAHEHTAKTMLQIVRKQGGIYIKSGQHVCASPVLPTVYVDTLKVLMDNAIPRTFEDTQKTWKEEFKTEITEVFPQINPVPIATASLAQVYEAYLPDGKKVAIKIQHRDVARLFNIDLSILRWYYSTVGWLFPNFNMTYLADELTRAFTEELDFETEAISGMKAKKLFASISSVVIPDVYLKYSSGKILTMAFEEGVRIDNLEEIHRMKINPKAAASTVMKLFSEMMFIYGFVHCDPHPGNILVRKANNSQGCEIVLLDHGTYQTLSEDVMYQYAKVWKSVITADFKGLEEATEAFGIDKKFSKFIGFVLTFSLPTKDPLVADTENFSQEDMENLAEELFGTQVESLDSELMKDYAQIFEKLPRSLLLLLKTNNLLRFINDQLGAPVNRFSIMGNLAVKGMIKVESEHSNGSIMTKMSGYYQIAKMKVFLFLHPIVQWIVVNVLFYYSPALQKMLTDEKGKLKFSFYA